MLKVLFLLLVVMSSATFAQTEVKPKAYLFDEFGEISQLEIKTRVEKFRGKLKENGFGEKSNKGLILFYYEKELELKKVQTYIRDALLYGCRDCFETGAVKLVIVGKAEKQRIQFWIIPFGAEPPEIIPASYIFAELSNASISELKNTLEKFSQKLGNGNIDQGYIITYGIDKEIAKREKQLRNNVNWRCDYDCPRLTLVRGGDTGKLKTVFWIVPYGAKPPNP